MTGRYAATKPGAIVRRRSGVTHPMRPILVANSNSYNVEKSGERFLITVKANRIRFADPWARRTFSPAMPHGCEGSDHQPVIDRSLCRISKRGP